MNEVSVLVIAYNKPDLLASSLEKLRKIEPRKIYIHLDGPQESIRSLELNTSCRLVIENFQKEFKEVEARVQTKNLGGKYGVLSALDWFFSNEEFGIILEEDIEFDDEIFKFTEFAKPLFKNPNLFAICFFNPVQDCDSNFFLNHWLPWGWASTSDQWQGISTDIRDPDLKVEHRFGSNPAARMGVRSYLNSIIGQVRKDTVKTWDAQVHASVINSGKMVLFPQYSLTKHLGIRPEATHADLVDWWSHISIGHFQNGMPIDVNDSNNLRFEKIWRMSKMALLSNLYHRMRTFLLRIVPLSDSEKR